MWEISYQSKWEKLPKIETKGFIMHNRSRNQNRGFNEDVSRTSRGQQYARRDINAQSAGSRNAYEADRFGQSDRDDYHADRLSNGYNTQTDRFEFDRDDRQQQWDPSFHQQSYSGDMNASDSWKGSDARNTDWSQPMARHSSQSHSYSQGRYEGSGYMPEGQSGWSQPRSRSDRDLNQTDLRHAGKGPKSYKRSDDRIKEDVCEALERHAGIDASEVDVVIKEGVATLSGTIESRQMKRMTEDCVENIRGVTDVRNELRIDTTLAGSPRSHSSSDSDSIETSNRNSSMNGKSHPNRSSSSASVSTPTTKQ
jgi:osmotically-inducible protein OsmY